jgi:hypothetical protein
MDERRPETLRAAEIPFEAELRRALATAPSPSFVAGVRARIAAQPRGRRIGVAVWAAAGLALAASIAIAVGVLRSGHSTVLPELPAPAGTTASAPAITPDRAPVKDGSGMATRMARPVQRRAVEAAAGGIAEPQVLIDPRERAAIRRLLEMRSPVRETAERVLPATPFTAGPLLPARELVVSPITIDPLEVAGQ